MKGASTREQLKFIYFWKHNIIPNLTSHWHPKSSSLAEGLHTFQLHTIRFKPLKGAEWATPSSHHSLGVLPCFEEKLKYHCCMKTGLWPPALGELAPALVPMVQTPNFIKIISKYCNYPKLSLNQGLWVRILHFLIWPLRGLTQKGEGTKVGAGSP